MSQEQNINKKTVEKNKGKVENQIVFLMIQNLILKNIDTRLSIKKMKFKKFILKFLKLNNNTPRKKKNIISCLKILLNTDWQNRNKMENKNIIIFFSIRKVIK